MTDTSSETGALFSVCFLLVGAIIPVLQPIATVATIIVACGTLLLNGDKYIKKIKSIIKLFKKQDSTDDEPIE